MNIIPGVKEGADEDLPGPETEAKRAELLEWHRPLSKSN